MDFSEFNQDNLKNCRLQSSIPDRTTSEPCWLGIDEAGRGPVLGPMVYGTCFSPLSDKEKIEKMGFTDSKALTEEQREKLFEKISESLDFIGWMIEIISPTTISTNMSKRSKYNLNLLSHDAAIDLIRRALDAGVNVTEVYVDTVGDPIKYEAKLSDIYPELKITVAKKADSTYTIVSAASICAKVARDRAVKSWNFQEGLDSDEINYGSGYPNDPETKKFLVNNLDQVFGFPQFVRFSWSTAEKIIQENAVDVLWDDDEDDSPAKDTPSVLSFFKKDSSSNIKKRHPFLSDSALSQTMEF